MKRFLTTFFVFILFEGFLLAQEENPFELYKSNWIGKEIPNFKAITLEGNSLSFSELKGKVVLINMWFINCPGCKVEYPGLQTLKKRFASTRYANDVVFLSLALDSKEKLQTFLKQNPLDFLHIADSDWISKGIFKVLGFPTNLIVDKKGVVRHIKIGGSSQSADDIEYEMQQLLK